MPLSDLSAQLDHLRMQIAVHVREGWNPSAQERDSRGRFAPGGGAHEEARQLRASLRAQGEHLPEEAKPDYSKPRSDWVFPPVMQPHPSTIDLAAIQHLHATHGDQQIGAALSALGQKDIRHIASVFGISKLFPKSAGGGTKTTQHLISEIVRQLTDGRVTAQSPTGLIPLPTAAPRPLADLTAVHALRATYGDHQLGVALASLGQREIRHIATLLGIARTVAPHAGAAERSSQELVSEITHKLTGGRYTADFGAIPTAPSAPQRPAGPAALDLHRDAAAHPRMRSDGGVNRFSLTTGTPLGGAGLMAERRLQLHPSAALERIATNAKVSPPTLEALHDLYRIYLSRSFRSDYRAAGLPDAVRGRLRREMHVIRSFAARHGVDVTRPIVQFHYLSGAAHDELAQLVRSQITRDLAQQTQHILHGQQDIGTAELLAHDVALHPRNIDNMEIGGPGLRAERAFQHLTAAVRQSGRAADAVTQKNLDRLLGLASSHTPNRDDLNELNALYQSYQRHLQTDTLSRASRERLTRESAMITSYLQRHPTARMDLPLPADQRAAIDQQVQAGIDSESAPQVHRMTLPDLATRLAAFQASLAKHP